MELGDTIRSTTRLLGDILQSRLELFSLETSIERRRLITAIFVAIVGGGSVLVAFVFLGLFIMLLNNEDSRVYIAGIWAFLALSLACVSCIALWILFKGNKPFSNTQAEIRKDLACLETTLRSSE